MRRHLLAALALLLAGPAAAEPIVDGVAEGHILPGFARLDAAAAALDEAAAADCAAENPALRDAYQAAFDAWMGVSHLRFGPTERESRGFVLAFWPDGKGATPKALRRLISGDFPLDDPAEFEKVSIAARGFFALDALLYDADFTHAEPEARRCALVRAVAKDAARIAAALDADWRETEAPLLRAAGANDAYRSREEALRALLTQLSAGLEFTADARLGQPMGAFDRPRPQRAEARRSGRPLRNVQLSLAALHDLANRLAAALPPEARGEIDAAFARAEAQAARLDDPDFAAVETPMGRLRLESLQQAIRAARRVAIGALGPALGVAAGFNAADGD